MKRNVAIDIAKGICIILVVIGHYHPDNSPTWYNMVNRFIYSFHMPLFMFASGYIYMATYKPISYGLFLWKKIKRLMIPYFSTSAIVITLKLFSQQRMYVENPVSIHSYLKMFYSPEAGYFLWFIWALWGMFLVVPLFRTPKSKIILLLASLLVDFIPIQWPEIFCIRQFVGMLKYFMIGVLLSDYSIRFQRLKTIPFWLPCIIFIFLFSLKQYFQTGTIEYLLDFTLPFLGIYMICMISIVISKNTYKIRNSLTFISISSYIIYLFHTTFEGFAKSAIHKVPILTDSNNFVGFSIGAIIVVCCGILLSIVMHRYILERNLILRFLFGLKSKNVVKQ